MAVRVALRRSSVRKGTALQPLFHRKKLDAVQRDVFGIVLDTVVLQITALQDLDPKGKKYADSSQGHL